MIESTTVLHVAAGELSASSHVASAATPEWQAGASVDLLTIAVAPRS